MKLSMKQLMSAVLGIIVVSGSVQALTEHSFQGRDFVYGVALGSVLSSPHCGEDYYYSSSYDRYSGRPIFVSNGSYGARLAAVSVLLFWAFAMEVYIECLRAEEQKRERLEEKERKEAARARLFNAPR